PARARAVRRIERIGRGPRPRSPSPGPTTAGRHPLAHQRRSAGAAPAPTVGAGASVPDAVAQGVQPGCAHRARRRPGAAGGLDGRGPGRAGPAVGRRRRHRAGAARSGGRMTPAEIPDEERLARAGLSRVCEPALPDVVQALRKYGAVAAWDSLVRRTRLLPDKLAEALEPRAAL